MNDVMQSNKANCDSCGCELEDHRGHYEYDYSIQCDECKKKSKWFISGLITGIFVSIIVFLGLFDVRLR